MSRISCFGNTDMGRARTNNEDAFVAQTIWDDQHILAVAIDGVGGYEGGEVAAEIARKSIVEYLEKYSNGERLDLLKQAVVSANNAIFDGRKNQLQYSNMSCVLTAVLVDEVAQRINMAHVGDTRLYQYCDGELIKLSHDHSLVGYREEIGELTEEEAMRHPQRNIISRDVGSAFIENNGSDYVEAASFPLEANSILLLCSDGLCDMITSTQMKEILAQDITLAEKNAALIAAANEMGGKDNITVVLVEVDTLPVKEEESQLEYPEEPMTQITIPLPEAEDTIPEVAPRRRRVFWLWILGGIVLFVAGFMLGGYYGEKIFPSLFDHPVTPLEQSVEMPPVEVIPTDTIMTESL